MKENKNPSETGMVVLSSDAIKRTMQPRLKTMLSLNVINDNGNPQSSAKKQMWLVGVGAAIALMVTFFI